MPSIKKTITLLLALSIAISCLVFPSAADEAYYGYNYNWWGDAVPSQNGYVVERVVNGRDMGLDTGLSEPNDMYVYNKTGEIYIVDSKHNQIVITDADLDATQTRTMSEFTYGEDYTLDRSKVGQTTTLNNPMGVFVMDDNGRTLIYIADHSNDRVLACYENGEIWMEYTRPSSDLYDASVTFNPRKVIVDKARNVYVCVKSITQGSVVFAEDGKFNGFFGANRVEQTADVLTRQFFRLFMTREQLIKMRRTVPIEFSNFDIDPDGFIYTVTELKSAETDVFKKLSPAGKNVLEATGYDDWFFGDWIQVYVNGKTWKSSIVDVEVDEYGNIYLLDFTMGRVFQYEPEYELLFTFGGSGDQKGNFTSPTAVETYNGKVYVLDSRKNSITIFKRTEFGAIVHNAYELYNKGLYEEAKEPWEEIMRRDSNYWMAYVGIGYAYLGMGEFDTAMSYFYKSTRGGYNRAFKDYRINFIRENFSYLAVGLIGIIVVLAGTNILFKRHKKKKLKLKMMGGDNK